MRLLLHICCGPCATATVGFWRGRGAELLGFFYNPNIQPLAEHQRRLCGVRDLAEIVGIEVIEDAAHGLEEWSQVESGPGTSRCAHCMRVRLERAAAETVASGCEAFSTTLSISPWQDHDAIKAEGERAAAAFGVSFVYEDLRRLYPETRRLSRDWGLYRQKYCGCSLSEWQQVLARKPKVPACS